MREDHRTLAEFHPDSKARSKLHHAFAQRFLPHWVFLDPKGLFLPCLLSEADPTVMIQGRWQMMEELIGTVERAKDVKDIVFRRVTGLSAGVEIIAGHPALFLTMPPPEGPTQAFYVGIVLLAPAGDPNDWPRNVSARYFLLERAGEAGEADVGHLCERTPEGVHRDLGIELPADRNAFRAKIAEVIHAMRPVPPAGRYVRERPAEGALPAKGKPLEGVGASPTGPKKPWWRLW